LRYSGSDADPPGGWEIMAAVVLIMLGDNYLFTEAKIKIWLRSNDLVTNLLLSVHSSAKTLLLKINRRF